MQFTVSIGLDAQQAIQDAENYPYVRLFTVGQGNISTVPQSEFISVEQPWSVATIQTVGGPDWDYFSAACWFFGKELYDTQQIPIGLVSSNWGGTIIQAWSSPGVLDACAASPEEEEEVDGAPNPNQNSVLWNAMIFPLLNMKIRGFTWYQGEANIGQENYACLFPSMIADWRNNWNNQNLGFYFVQLAPYTEGYASSQATWLPDTRLWQSLAGKLPLVGMASVIDAGDPDSPQGNIHPRNKQVVGHRLALLARQQLYGELDLQTTGPMPNNVMFAPNEDLNDLVVYVNFTNSSIGSGLVLNTTNMCPSGQPGNPQVLASQCAGFEIQSSDGRWHAVVGAAITTPNSIALAVNVNNPLLTPWGVRYGYNWWPVASLFNAEGLPAPPFYIELVNSP